jgi:hypothetical protein
VGAREPKRRIKEQGLQFLVLFPLSKQKRKKEKETELVGCCGWGVNLCDAKWNALSHEIRAELLEEGTRRRCERTRESFGADRD